MLKPRRFVVVALSAAGVTVLTQALAFFRQLLVAAYFGVSRDLDIYVIAYTVAMMFVFSFAITFDSAVVPRLIQARETGGERAAHALAVSVFRWSCVLSALATIALVALTPLLAPLVATGFDASQKADLSRLVWFFAPWTFLCLPYYAASARHKAKRNFNRVFRAEIVICIVSIAVLFLFHDEVALLPWAYAAGYGSGLLSLLFGAGLLGRGHGMNADGTGAALRNVGELYLANQSGSLGSIVDRHFQSLVPAGGIAAVNYSSQLITGIIGLLAFREIYIVPLAEADRREEKLERLIIGLLLLAIPAAAFTASFAHDIVKMLFERGRFDAAATDLTASLLRIYAFVLIPSMIGSPLARMLQIVGRTNLIHLVYLSNAIAIAMFGTLFVVWLRLDTQGIAWMLLTAATLSTTVTAGLVARTGLSVRWGRVARYAFFAMLVAAVATGLGLEMASQFNGAVMRLIMGGATFGIVIGSAYFAVRRRLLTISG